jgi:hypothetical protein
MLRDRDTIRGKQAIVMSGECADRNCGDCTDESCTCPCHREDEPEDYENESP